ncbi:MAG: hypothetical protein EHM68_15280 [Lysobacterales bacterium]|nr:MAG: hypothetical protein EHM68_15280 [Xanthomonadales bacterium]
MNDEQLILYYYADGLSKTERRRIEAALAADPALQSRYDALRRELDGFGDASADAPAAPEHLVARWQAGIDRAAQLERQTERGPARVLHLASFGWGAAITGALALGIGIGVYLPSRNVPDVSVTPLPAIVEVAPSATTGDAFTRGLQAHFRESRENIGGLAVEDSEARRLLILHIVQQNRLFARAATENQSPELSRVLRAFEPILVRLADEDLAPEEAQRLQAQLLFELNVMLTKMNRPPSDRSESI